jgi:hypothetical protein
MGWGYRCGGFKGGMASHLRGRGMVRLRCLCLCLGLCRTQECAEWKWRIPGAYMCDDGGGLTMLNGCCFGALVWKRGRDGRWWRIDEHGEMDVC